MLQREVLVTWNLDSAGSLRMCGGGDVHIDVPEGGLVEPGGAGCMRCSLGAEEGCCTSASLHRSVPCTSQVCRLQ